MIEKHVAVTRHARYALLGELSSSIREIWIVCHGFGQLARDFIPAFGPIATPQRLIVAPEALSHFYLNDTGGMHGPDTPVGATWMTREDRDHEIQDYVAYLDKLVGDLKNEIGRADLSVTALGFSQGGATVCRWSALGRTKIDRLIVWGSLVPPEFDSAEKVAVLLNLDFTLITGNRDQYITEKVFAKELERLQGLGLAPKTEIFEGGHQLNRSVICGLAGLRC